MKLPGIYSLILATLLLAVAGCGKGDVQLSRVHGRVTLDGQPLARAAVILAPLGGAGGPAYAVTDDDGRYEVAYTHDRKGAVVGECIVRIKTGFQSIEDEEQRRVRRETVPERYNTQSTLVVNVQPGGGPYDFELTSDGQ
jgi:hypothetical protein